MCCILLQSHSPGERCEFSGEKGVFEVMRSYIHVQLNSSEILQCNSFVEANIGSNVNL